MNSAYCQLHYTYKEFGYIYIGIYEYMVLGTGPVAERQFFLNTNYTLIAHSGCYWDFNNNLTYDCGM